MPSVNAADADMIVKATQGDKNAKTGLFRRHIKQIYFICVTLRGYLPDASDICADVFAEMYRDLPSLDKILDFRRWFYANAVSYCARRSLETPVQRSRTVETTLADLEDKASSSLDNGLLSEHEVLRYQMVSAILEYMPLKQAAAVLYFDFAGGKTADAEAYPFIDGANIDSHRQAAGEFIKRQTAFLKGRGTDISDLTRDLPAALERLAEDTHVPAAAYELTAKKTGLNIRPPKYEMPVAPVKEKKQDRSNQKNAKVNIMNAVIPIAIILVIALIFAVMGAVRRNRSEKTNDERNDSAVVYWNGEIASGFSSGEGTADSPYIITTGDELAYLSGQLLAAGNEKTASAYYTLGGNIALNTTTNFSDWDMTPPEHGWTPIGDGTPFSGVFDGAGYTISGLYVESDGMGGLFGRLHNATIKDLHLEQAYIKAGDTAGGIAATAEFDAELPVIMEKLSFKGKVFSTGAAAGGIAGIFGQGGVLSRCSSEGAVTAEGAAGGIIGAVTADGGRLSVNNSYSRCEVSGKTTGGIAGSNTSTNGGDALILKCYNSGRVFITAEKGRSGAICGNNSGTVQNCFYLENTADLDSVNTGEGKTVDTISLTETEMTQDKYFTGFDFTDYWEFAGENGYKFPTLR